MKVIKQFGVSIILASLLAGNVWADRPYYDHRPRSSVSLGVYVGDPWIYPHYYPYPYPYYVPRVYLPPVVVAPPPPQVYVEQPVASATVPTLESGFWYYCKEAQAYYPYVKQCPGSWQKVAPQPAQ